MKKLLVSALNHREPVACEFSEETLVGEAADQAAKRFARLQPGKFSFCESGRSKYVGSIVYRRKMPVSTIGPDTVELCDVTGIDDE